MSPDLRFRILAIVSDAALPGVLDRLDEILDPAIDTVSWFEEGKRMWRIEALTAAEPDRNAVEVALGAPFTVEPLPDVDWLAENRKSFQPVHAGRFFVHPGDWAGEIPDGVIPIEVDAGLAFGSGTHETTRGCLLMIDGVLRRQRVSRAADVGCGSGLLAIAMKKAGIADVTAGDIDPVAVRVADENASRNLAGRGVRTVTAAGWRHRALSIGPPFDLIAANILAGPLIRLAAETASRTAPGGAVILSGLLHHQAPPVRTAYRRTGLRFERSIRLGDWVTLRFRKPTRGKTA